MAKPVISLLLAVAVVLSLCMHFVPGRQHHVDEVAACVTDALRNDSYSLAAISGAAMSRLEAGYMVRAMVEKMTLFEDYAVFSMCKVKGADDEYMLSIGVLDNVFVLAKKGMTEKIFLDLRQKKIID